MEVERIEQSYAHQKLKSDIVSSPYESSIYFAI